MMTTIPDPKSADGLWRAAFDGATALAVAMGLKPSAAETIAMAGDAATAAIAQIEADRQASAIFLARLRAKETPPADIPDPD